MEHIVEEYWVIMADKEGDYYEGFINDEHLITPYFEDAQAFEYPEFADETIDDIKDLYPEAQIVHVVATIGDTE